MNGLKVTTALALFAALPAQALSEMKPLNAAEMGVVTAQAGITIDMSVELSMRQLRYEDQGSLALNNIRLAGSDFTSPLDNMRMTIDLAGDGEVLNYGFSEIAERAANGVISTGEPGVADILSTYDQGGGQYGAEFGDGDAVIHIGAVDYGDPSSISDFVNAVDFGLTIDDVSLMDSSGVAGTAMFSDISLRGAIGPTDIVIRNANTTSTLANGNEVSDGRLEVSTNFVVDDLDMNWNVGDVILLFNFAALQIEDMQIHNRRGANGGQQLGMASASATFSEGTSALSGTTGLAVYDVNFRADLDMPTVRIGNDSIGSVYFTDFHITDTNTVVYGH